MPRFGAGGVAGGVAREGLLQGAAVCELGGAADGGEVEGDLGVVVDGGVVGRDVVRVIGGVDGEEGSLDGGVDVAVADLYGVQVRFKCWAGGSLWRLYLRRGISGRDECLQRCRRRSRRSGP